MSISVVILTFNSEESIAATLESAKRVSDDIHVVDSFSSDGTVDIITQQGANVVQHPFENYGAQRNWAIDNLPLKYDWELHLDADERLSEELVVQLNSVRDVFSRDIDGYYIPRLVHFMGRAIRHGGMFPIWHMRLFRHGRGRCEDRHYDQHFYVSGSASKMQGAIIDDVRMTLDEWVSRHNRWADAEVREILSSETAGRIQADVFGTPVQKKRLFRNVYSSFPLFVRPFFVVRLQVPFSAWFLRWQRGIDLLRFANFLVSFPG